AFVCSSRKARECWNWRGYVVWFGRSIRNHWPTLGKMPFHASTHSAKPCRRLPPRPSAKKNLGQPHSNASGMQLTPQPDCALRKSTYRRIPELASSSSAYPVLTGLREL